ncbi:MAG: RNA ligase [Ardenticatenaceae bacterium]
MNIESIADIQRLLISGFDKWAECGDVVVRRKGELAIFNYSAAAQYAERWNFFERVSRGLILNALTGEVVARSFDKFFNWAEGARTTEAPLVMAIEKMDGSLGILYRDNGYKIATRGSFESTQAQWATRFLNATYQLDGLPDEWTLLFEIIFPDNRIVVDYGAREDLVLLAIRNRHTGDYLPHKTVRAVGEQYGFSLPKVYHFQTVEEMTAQQPLIDSNQEGWIALFADGQIFKFKGLAYLKLHKLVTGLTFNKVLSAMQNNSIQQILDVVPDEFLDETYQWIDEIQHTIKEVTQQITTTFQAAPKATRKEFAIWTLKHHKPIATYLFAMLDGRDIQPLIYKHAFKERT